MHTKSAILIIANYEHEKTPMNAYLTTFKAFLFWADYEQFYFSNSIHLRSCRKDLWVYTLSVTSHVACPRIFLFAFSLASALSSSVANVCRVSCGVCISPRMHFMTRCQTTERYREYPYGRPEESQIRLGPGMVIRWEMIGRILGWMGMTRMPEAVLEWVTRKYLCRKLTSIFSILSISETRRPV